MPSPRRTDAREPSKGRRPQELTGDRLSENRGAPTPQTGQVPRYFLSSASMVTCPRSDRRDAQLRAGRVRHVALLPVGGRGISFWYWWYPSVVALHSVLFLLLALLLSFLVACDFTGFLCTVFHLLAVKLCHDAGQLPHVLERFWSVLPRWLQRRGRGSGCEGNRTGFGPLVQGCPSPLCGGGAPDRRQVFYEEAHSEELDTNALGYDA